MKMYGKYLRRIKIEPMAFNLFKCGVPSGVHEPHGIQRNFCDESVIRNHHGYCTKENLKRKLVMVLYHNHIMPRIRTDPTPPSITSPHLTPLHLPYPTSPHHSPTWPHSSHLTSPTIPPFQYPISNINTWYFVNAPSSYLVVPVVLHIQDSWWWT